MGLLLSDYLPAISDKSKSPSTVKITLPKTPTGRPKTIIEGVTEGDVSFSLSNSFGPLIPDMTSLQDWFFIADQAAFPAWISASGQTWRGTDPVRLSLSFYMINWKPDLGIEQKLANLASFATLDAENGGEDRLIKVYAHGGYTPDLLENNKSSFLGAGRGGVTETLKNKESFAGKFSNEGMSSSDLDDITSINEDETKQGLITIEVGTRFKVYNMMMLKLNITPSIVEVYSPSAGNDSKKPLYYKIDASFQSNKTALSTQVNGFFGL